jgi:predicted glycoside hydrolase/deacetylase ChbG (UPF0249 family)
MWSRPAILISADDLGASEAVNSAVLKAFFKRFISGANTMANAATLEHPFRLITKHNLADRVGISLMPIHGKAAVFKIIRRPSTTYVSKR